MTRGCRYQKKGSNAGRPSRYKADYHPDKVRKLALLGLTDKEICDIFDITTEMFWRWKQDYPDFNRMLYQGRTLSIADVIDSLYHKAIGYNHPETKVFYNPKTDEMRTMEVTKHYAPDTGAAAFILKNKTRTFTNPWKDAYEHEVSGKDGGPINVQQDVNLQDLTEEQKDLLYKMSQNSLERQSKEK